MRKVHSFDQTVSRRSILCPRARLNPSRRASAPEAGGAGSRLEGRSGAPDRRSWSLNAHPPYWAGPTEGGNPSSDGRGGAV